MKGALARQRSAYCWTLLVVHFKGSFFPNAKTIFEEIFPSWSWLKDAIEQTAAFLCIKQRQTVNPCCKKRDKF